MLAAPGVSCVSVPFSRTFGPRYSQGIGHPLETRGAHPIDAMTPGSNLALAWEAGFYRRSALIPIESDLESIQC